MQYPFRHGIGYVICEALEQHKKRSKRLKAMTADIASITLYLQQANSSIKFE